MNAHRNGGAQPEGVGHLLLRGMRQIRSEEGANLVEFAISAAVFFAILIGAFEFSWAAYAYHYVSDAAREATRYAIVRGSDCVGMPDCDITDPQIDTWVKNLGYPGITPGSLKATTTWLAKTPTSTGMTWVACAGQCNAPGNAVNVVVTYTFPLSIPFWQNTDLTLSSSSQMVISQ
jgi:Flp pilus assembly protein TadG